MDDKSIGKSETVLPGDGGGKDVLSPGQMLGDYKIIVLLGRGGMGEVYRAENRVTGRQVALKVIAREATRGPDFVERFRMEARVMSDLEHPGIVRVHHAGEAGGRYYLTMDLVEGGTLEEVWSAECGMRSSPAVPAGKMDEERIRDIALQICDALSYAHGKGIVHRDLKPANILLEVQGSGFKVQSSGGKTGAPVAAPAGHKGSSTPHSALRTPHYKTRVTDFGLAKAVGEDFVTEVVKKSVSLTMGRSIGEVETRVPGSSKRARYEGTSTGAILGTYEYMSPEQQAGGEVTKQSDLYSLGIILYWMLTGRKPKGMAKPPGHYGCSPQWDAILGKCLEVDFQDRYTSADEVAGDLKGMKLAPEAGGHGTGKIQNADGPASAKATAGRRERTGMGLGRGTGWILALGLLSAGVWWGLARDGGTGPSEPVDPPVVTPTPTIPPLPDPTPVPTSLPPLEPTPAPLEPPPPTPTPVQLPPPRPTPLPPPPPPPSPTPIPPPTPTPSPPPTPRPPPPPTPSPTPRVVPPENIKRPPAPGPGEVAFRFTEPGDAEITIRGERYRIGPQMLIGLRPGSHRFSLHLRGERGERTVHGLLEIPTPRSAGIFDTVFGESPEVGGILFPPAQLDAALRGRPVSFRIMALDDHSRLVVAAEYRLSLREIH